jgi:hypothetical protein
VLRLVMVHIGRGKTEVNVNEGYKASEFFMERKP